VPLEERVVQALNRVRPYMESHGGNVELLGIEDGVARLRLEGSCKTCSASSATLELAVRQALEEMAPDLLGMDVEVCPTRRRRRCRACRCRWCADPCVVRRGRRGIAAGGRPDGCRGERRSLVIGNVDGTLLAYRNTCVSCGGPLDAGVLSAGALTCPGCGRSFFLPRAGRSLDDDGVQLEPVPLLRENGGVRVALAS